MPAENDPAEPNALTQSLQLTCSLTPSNTVPSTRLVIIWLKRCLARSRIESPLESAPVGVGLGEGVGVGIAVGVGVGVEVDTGEGEDDCAAAGIASASSSTSDTAAVNAADRTKLRLKVAMSAPAQHAGGIAAIIDDRRERRIGTRIFGGAAESRRRTAAGSESPGRM